MAAALYKLGVVTVLCQRSVAAVALVFFSMHGADGSNVLPYVSSSKVGVGFQRAGIQCKIVFHG